MQSYSQIQTQGCKISEMVFHLTDKFPKYGDEGLTKAIRQSACKIVGNIEQGCGNPYGAEAICFFRSSLKELKKLEACISKAKEVGCMGMVGFEILTLNIERCKGQLLSQMNYHKQILFN